MVSSATTSSSASRYPYPSTVNIANYVSIKLPQTSFLLWKTQILALIESPSVQAAKTKLLSSTDDSLHDPSLYTSIVGGLYYLIMTLPDIAFAVNTLCQEDPSLHQLIYMHSLM